MFRTDSGSLHADDVSVAQALADVATITIVQHQAITSAKTLNSPLQEALNSRIVIEQAKGKVSESLHIDMGQAFRLIRNQARRHNLRLTDLSRGIAEGTIPCSDMGPPPVERA